MSMIFVQKRKISLSLDLYQFSFFFSFHVSLNKLMGVIKLSLSPFSLPSFPFLLFPTGIPLSIDFCKKCVKMSPRSSFSFSPSFSFVQNKVFFYITIYIFDFRNNNIEIEKHKNTKLKLPFFPLLFFFFFFCFFFSIFPRKNFQVNFFLILCQKIRHVEKHRIT